MIRLIADSGSTKTDWCVCQSHKPLQRISTQGINPFHQSPEEIAQTVFEMTRQLNDKNLIERIEFYGAGCALPEKRETLRCILANHLPHCTDIFVTSDLMGAAIATCQGKPGIACILGTGSNSCQFDGENIVANTPSLGYILGDEGSGSHLGRTLVSDYLKKQLPSHICQLFSTEYGLDQATVLENVYRKPLANRYLAGFAPFLNKHREEPAIHALLIRCFKTFFQRNVIAYDTTLPIHFIGSIAYHFKEEIAEAAQLCGLIIGRTFQTPMEGLIESCEKRQE